MYDARFHVFLELTKLLGAFVPPGHQFTDKQAEAVRASAKKIADDLTSGEYV